MIAALSEAEDLRGAKSQAEEMARMRHEVCEWASEMEPEYLWADVMDPGDESVTSNLAKIRYLTDQNNVNALDPEQLTTLHERLKAARSDMTASVESQRIAVERMRKRFRGKEK
jgi:hypothetical protein